MRCFFNQNVLIFFFSNKNVVGTHKKCIMSASNEYPQIMSTSNEYPQHMFCEKIRKILSLCITKKIHLGLSKTGLNSRMVLFSSGLNSRRAICTLNFQTPQLHTIYVLTWPLNRIRCCILQCLIPVYAVCSGLSVQKLRVNMIPKKFLTLVLLNRLRSHTHF